MALPITAIAVTIGLLSPQLASASRSGDPRTELEKVRAQQANVASGVNASKATLAEIDQALQALDNNVSSQQRLLSDANQAEAEATREADAADAAVQRITKEQAKLHKAVAARAVAAYMNPPADDLLTMLQTKDITMANDRKLFVELRATRDSDLADQLRGLGRDLDYQRGRAKSAKELATRKRDEQRQRTLKVERAQAAKKKLADGIQARIDSQVAVSIKLARTNKALSTQIALQQAQLAARLAAERAVAAAAQAAANRRPPASTFRPTGGESRPLPPVSVPPSGGAGGLTTVGGITVSSQIAGQLANMLNAARSSGLTLTGSGYRDPAQQIELRRQHCGSSYYAIYQMSPSACSPPTARPGTSMHEVGLAIDFSNCSSRGSACFQWLSGNASRFGFYNLPSEPWHWSINGN